jgi:hypothetical protein
VRYVSISPAVPLAHKAVGYLLREPAVVEEAEVLDLRLFGVEGSCASVLHPEPPPSARQPYRNGGALLALDAQSICADLLEVVAGASVATL